MYKPTEWISIIRIKGSAHPQRKEVTHHEETGRERQIDSPLRKTFP